MKREHGGDDDRFGGGRNYPKRSKGDGFSEALAQGKFELRLLVSSKAAGAVIGKGGDNIKRIRSEFEGQISVPDSNSPERVLTVVSESGTVIRMVEDLLPRLDDGSNDRPDKCEIRLLVHQSHAGALIGRQGSKIKELRDRTNARIKVFQQCCPQSTDRVAMISGEDRNVIDAVSVIIEELKEIPIKGPSNPYTSFNYDPLMAVEYGGYQPLQFPPNGRGPMGPPGGRFGGPSGGPPRAGGRGPPGMGGPPRGPNMDMGRFDQGPPPSSYGGGPFHAPPSQHHMAPPQYAPQPLSFGFPGQQIQTTQVTIPSDLGGTIIGRGGDRINRIREESGAQIMLEPSNGQEERIITITGTQSQIHAAQYLLQQCVRTSIAGRKYIDQQASGGVSHGHR